MKVSKLASVTVGTALAGTAMFGSAAPAFADTTPSADPTPSAAATPAPSALPAPPSAKGCLSGELPPVVLGSPGLKAHQTKGVYLWHDKNGYALRVTEASSKPFVVTGTITVSGDISQVKRVRFEKNDRVTVRGRTLTFQFVNHGGIDGVNFSAECSKTVHVALRADGQPFAPEMVFLGEHRQHPTSVPFTIERARDTTPASVS